MVIETIDTYQDESQIVNRGFDSIFEASVKLGDKVGALVFMQELPYVSSTKVIPNAHLQKTTSKRPLLFLF